MIVERLYTPREHSLLVQHLGDRMKGGDVKFFEEMIERKWLGRKTSIGLFTYEGKKKEVNEKVLSMMNSYRSGRPDVRRGVLR